MENKKIVIVAAVLSVAIAGALVAAINSKDDNSENKITSVTDKASAISVLTSAANKVSLTDNHASKGTITYSENEQLIELPDIDTSYPLSVMPQNKDIVAEIFVSPEKAGSGMDGWMRELAESFNEENYEYNGQKVGIAVRPMSSGTQIDYIESGVYLPDGFTPSASMWGDMVEFNGIDIETINPRLVGNVAGVLIDKNTYNTLSSQNEDKSVSIKDIINATESGTIVAGYTNPFSSTSGLNFLASTLYSYDETNPLSSTAIDGFNRFQNNIPFVAYNTMQMRSAAENNTFSCLIMEYQSYINQSDLKNNYEFIPYGIRHDNPLYILETTAESKKQTINMFNDYCMTDSAQKMAYEYGFNNLDDYSDTIPNTDGNTWIQMQKTWKNNKNTSKPIAAVFVLDTSGSMSGEPIAALKTSLSNSMKYINSTNYIGVVSFASNVNVEVPIDLFNINQQAFFEGAVSGLNASGGTSSYSALAKAVLMLDEFMETNPNVQPMIFLLSDGEQNEGASFKDISDALKFSEIPVYTIGYNANLEELKKVSQINEAASIDADSDDVVYQLKNLFNANL